MNIRNAIEKDLQCILEIINHAIENTTAVYDYSPRTLKTQQEWFAKKTADKMPVIVVEIDNKVVGFGSYGIFRPWDGYRFSVEHSIYISEKYRGQGLGKKLLQELIVLAKKQEFHSMIAGIDADNPGSYGLHKKLGFKEVGRFNEVGYKFDRWLDLVFMQLMLKSSEL